MSGSCNMLMYNTRDVCSNEIWTGIQMVAKTDWRNGAIILLRVPVHQTMG